MLRRYATIACAVLAVSLGGCGGGQKTMSLSAYRTAADLICKRADLKVVASTAKAKSRPQVIAAWRKLITIIGGEVAALEKLRPPSDFQQIHLRAVAARRGELQQARRALALITAGSSPHTAGAAIKSSVTRLTARERAAWRDAGVTICAQ